MGITPNTGVTSLAAQNKFAVGRWNAQHEQIFLQKAEPLSTSFNNLICHKTCFIHGL